MRFISDRQMSERSRELLDCRDRLEVATRACRELLAEDCNKEVSLAELIALARKVTPSTRPPPGTIFNEKGPVDALPIRFRLPYPTLDEMRMSLVATEGNKWKGQEVVKKVQAAPPSKPVIEDDDDFEDEF